MFSLTILKDKCIRIITFESSARVWAHLVCQVVFAFNIFVHVLAPRRIWIHSFIWNNISIRYVHLNLLADNNHPKLIFISISTWLPVLPWLSTKPFANIIKMNIERMGPSWWVPIFSPSIVFLKLRNNPVRFDFGRFLDILFYLNKYKHIQYI